MVAVDVETVSVVGINDVAKVSQNFNFSSSFASFDSAVIYLFRDCGKMWMSVYKTVVHVYWW